MATNIIMPSLGFDMTEGKLSSWLKNEGDLVEKGQAIAEIETEKATVEIEATVPGRLQKIIVPAGQTVPVGTIIAMIAEAGESTPSTSTPQTAMPQPKPETAKPKPTSPPIDSAAGGSEPGGTQSVDRGGDGEAVRGDGSQVREAGERIKASPLARRMAKEAGIDLASIKGSGPGGRIMERDVQSASADHTAAAPSPAAPPSAPQVAPAPVAPPAPPSALAAARPPTGETVPLNRMRQAIARRMTESKTTVPHFYVTMEIDMSEGLKLREQLNAFASDADKVSINDLIVAAVARTLLDYPNFNASFRDGALEKHPQINIGIAVAVQDGLLTPVLRDADKKSIKAIAAEARQLGERARINKMHSDDLGGSTFTVSNLGMFGVDEFVAIINPPEAAILAVGAAVRRPVVVGDDDLRVVPVMKVTLSVDHRVADGAQAARFLQALKKLLESPINLVIRD